MGRFVDGYFYRKWISENEPPEGNPFRLYLSGRLISQDLANAVIEYYSIREQFRTTTTGRL